ncbi:hypothetical protein [Actinoplanes sp. N902-109]|uniref:hypothetical protein n=1 Tax=Actinoplanes sp. (strain N902-109) TaxID=649831 RepID=UPI00032938AC|nr:hypothetical protein [Actinoplanes sp. N902-109]AGL21593.1 hypothetical protein L083_8083 [Actinoplanes sp. N902-109]
MALRGVPAALLAVVAGLVPGQPPAPVTPPPAEVLTRSADGYPRDGFGLLAVVRGTVRIAEGCLVIDGGAGPSLVIWPYGTRWLADGSALVLPDGSVLRIGSSVTGGGGHTVAGRRQLRMVADAGTVERVVDCSRRTTKAVSIFNSYGWGPIGQA